jgi:DNA-binding winged helix-turn-helix (wHTH) protein
MNAAPLLSNPTDVQEISSPDAVSLPALPLTIGEDAKWFRIGEANPIDLSRRRPLTRILWALAKARGETLIASDLIDAGWPGERIVRHAARIRLRVAIATLRSMGLVSHILTTRTGYALPPNVVIEESSLEPASSDIIRTVTEVPPACDEVAPTESIVPDAEPELAAG